MFRAGPERRVNRSQVVAGDSCDVSMGTSSLEALEEASMQRTLIKGRIIDE
jgi:hypothetical protein